MGELGSRLVRVREARGLTLEDAERDTRISRRYLDALEAEQFDVIPAPVYARGFLRSYSQYLGLDPAEMLAMFPRDDDGLGPAVPDVIGAGTPSPRTQNGNRGRAPARPGWQRPPRPEPKRGVRPAERRQEAPLPEPPRRSEPVRRPEPKQPPSAVGPMIGATPPPKATASSEPTIGVDIGVPAPARRINTNPAGPARNLTVLFIAIAAVVSVVLIALLIANLGGDDAPPGTGSSSPTTGAGTGLTPISGAGTTASATAAASPGAVPTVPIVRDMTASQAKTALEAAGYVVRERRQKSNVTRGVVIDQTNAGLPLAQGQEVIIVVSDGP